MGRCLRSSRWPAWPAPSSAGSRYTPTSSTSTQARSRRRPAHYFLIPTPEPWPCPSPARRHLVADTLSHGSSPPTCQKTVSTASIMVTHLQTTAIVSQLRLAWPQVAPPRSKVPPWSTHLSLPSPPISTPPCAWLCVAAVGQASFLLHGRRRAQLAGKPSLRDPTDPAAPHTHRLCTSIDLALSSLAPSRRHGPSASPRAPATSLSSTSSRSSRSSRRSACSSPSASSALSWS